jgi:PAS domain S-box-containing protein
MNDTKPAKPKPTVKAKPKVKVKAKPKPRVVESGVAEARFRAIFDTAAVGIGIMSLDRTLMDANPALCRLFGMSREELIGKTPEIVTYRGDFSKSSQDFKEMVSSDGNYYEAERRYVRKNGEIFWAHVTMTIVRDSSGKPLYIIGMVVDIDKQKRALSELQESEARFRASFQSSAIGMGLLALDGKILQVNDAVCQMSGYSAEELQQRYDNQNVYPEDLNVGMDLFAEVIEGKRSSFSVEKRYMRKSGEVFWTRLTLSLVRNPDGSPGYLVGMIEDINEQKRVLAELQESEARFRAMFDNVAIGMALVGFDRSIQAVNYTLEQISGYTAEELSRINISDLVYPQDHEVGMDEFRDLIAGHRESMQLERRYVRKNGEIFWARICYSLVRNSNKEPQYLVGSLEDITDRKRTADLLAAQESEYRRKLEQSVEERTHELRETNLRLVAEIEQRQLAEEALAGKAVEEAITAERTRLARDLHDAVTQTLFSASLIAEVLPELWQIDLEEARNSTEELRQLTRGALAEMRTLLLELRPAALTQARFPDLIKQLSEAVIGRARLPVNLNVEGDYELPPEVKIAFYRIAQESLNNIVKYARATQVDIKIQLNCCNVLLEVKDNGIGFELSGVKPTSLGMRIMRERAESIRAHFDISSTPGQGTIVSVTWNEDEIIPIANLLVRGES